MRVIGASTPGCNAGLIWMFVSAVFINRALTSAGGRFGCASRIKAAEPAIIGVAPEVPPNAVVLVPVPASAETDAPGAPMSGLIAFSLTLGPRADDETMLMARGVLKAGPTLTFTGAAMFALTRFDVACVMISVGTNVSPPPNEKLTGSPGKTSPIRTPIAPALAARSTFRLTAQVPRSMSATFPAGFARYASPGHPRPTKTTSPVKPEPIGAQPTVSVFL